MARRGILSPNVNYHLYGKTLLNFFQSKKVAADKVEPEPSKWSEAEMKRRKELTSNELVTISFNWSINVAPLEKS